MLPHWTVLQLLRLVWGDNRTLWGWLPEPVLAKHLPGSQGSKPGG